MADLSKPVAVTGGLVQGHANPVDPAVTTFLAIPYAAPPTGANRFRAPQPVIPWTGVRVCDTLAPVNYQEPPPWRYFDTLKGHPQSEDILYLNVSVPPADLPGPHPVLFWMHGGGYREGGNADKNFDGTGLAQKGVIVVVPNFRLGMLGFLAHPELSAEDPNGTSGNQGILDCVQALRWVQDNIASFGGDPTRVTVSGQSSGSAMTHILLLSPVTAGLMHRAIMHSGVKYTRDPLAMSTHPSYRRLEHAEEEGVEVVADLGAKSIAELRAIPDARVFGAAAASKKCRRHDPAPPFFRACLDGHIMPRMYTATLDGGPPNDIPCMTGQNDDEGGIYQEPRFTMDDLHASVEGRFGSGEFYKRFYETYPPADEEKGKGPLEAWNLACRDYQRVSISLWAQQYNQHCRSPVFGYYFTHAPQPYFGFGPDWNQPKVRGYELNKGPLQGAFHGAEFAYTFNSVITSDMRPWTDRDRAIGQTMSTLWANFAKYGDPNGREPERDRPAEVPQWPPLAKCPNVVMELGKRHGLIPLCSDKALQFWKDYFASVDATS